MRFVRIGVSCLVGMVAVLAVTSASIAVTPPPPPATAPVTTAPVTTAPPTTVPLTTTSLAAQPDRPKPAYLDHPQGARQTAAAYAYRWAETTNPEFALFLRGKITVPSDNILAIGRAVDSVGLGELDCTAYMSQALRTSGFAYVPSWRYSPGTHAATTAWVRAAGRDGLAATFMRLGRMHLLSVSGGAVGQPPPPGIQIGDIVVWDLNASRPMHIDHQLMVTEVSAPGTSWADIRVSYHTYDHRNRALDEYQNDVTADTPDARLYAFHVNYPS